MKTLQNMCVKKIVGLIKNEYWPYTPDGFNPFQRRRCEDIVDILVQAVIQDDDWNDSFDILHLMYLFRSSHVKSLILKDVQLPQNLLCDIFGFLSLACENVQRIQLVDCVDDAPPTTSVKNALNGLLFHSEKLQLFESCIPFDFTLVNDMQNLTTLVLHFPVEYNFFKFAPNYTVTRIELCQDDKNDKDDILKCVHTALILALSKFKQLKHINVCLNNVLVSIHSKNLKSNKISTEYDLEYCELGSKDGNKIYPATTDAVKIVAKTCPELKVLKIKADEETKGFKTLSKLHKLKEIDVEFESLTCFSPVKGLLRNVGNHLESITLFNVVGIDVGVIGNACPKLKSLKLDYCFAGICHACNLRAFSELTQLDLSFITDWGFRQSLFRMLTKSSKLESLKLSYVSLFDDDFFDCVLQFNQFTSLHTIHCFHTSATKEKIYHLSDLLDLKSCKWAL